jgi:hypothetical protein
LFILKWRERERESERRGGRVEGGETAGCIFEFVLVLVII